MAGTDTTYTAAELLDLANAGTTQSPLTTRTLRYYSSLKLVDPPVTRQGQAARYTDRHLRQLEVIRLRRAAGRGLAEIAAEFAADPDASTTLADRRAPAATVPAGLAMPSSSSGVMPPIGWPGSPIPASWPTAPNAHVVVIAPGVQVVLTGAAVGDRDLLARLIDAANPRRFPHPILTNGDLRD